MTPQSYGINRITNDRIKPIHDSYDRVGEKECARLHGISPATAQRYYYLYKSRLKTEQLEVELQLPNILILDIETLPLSAYVFSLWKQNINLDFIQSDWFMVCWSAKWLNEDTVYSDCLRPDEVLNENDKRICVSIWEMIDAADIIIAHNGKRFDIPKLNTRFILNNLNPPSPYQQIDTYQIAKKVFGFSSNKLDQVNRQLGIERKLDTDAKLWVACRKGDQKALTEMEIYNRNDVVILEKTYLRLRSWMPSHPNMATYNDDNRSQCSICGSYHIEPSGEYHTGVSRFKAFKCLDCGGVSRGRVNGLSLPKRKQLLSSVAR